jgi:hypothetical protein
MEAKERARKDRYMAVEDYILECLTEEEGGVIRNNCAG